MAHGIYFHSKVSHGEIVDFSTTVNIPRGNYEDFKSNYDFVWDIYKSVADQHGLVLPRFWVTCDRYSRRVAESKRYRRDGFIMEPMGPTLTVDSNYSLNQYMSGSIKRGTALYTANWRKVAEQFFMVRGSAYHALNDRYVPHEALLCERWKAKSIRLTLAR